MATPVRAACVSGRKRSNTWVARASEVFVVISILCLSANRNSFSSSIQGSARYTKPMSRRINLVDDSFFIAVIGKCAGGVVELATGILLIFLSVHTLQQLLA